MKKIITLIAIFLSTSYLYSQHNFGPYGGIGFGNIKTDNGSLDESKFAPQFNVGLNYTYKFRSPLRTGASLEYTNNAYLLNFFSIEGTITSTSIKVDYLSLPLEFGYDFGEKLYVSPIIKLIPAINIVSGYKFPNVSEPNGTTYIDTKDQTKGFNLSGGVGVELGFNANKVNFFTLIEYRHSLTPNFIGVFSENKSRLYGPRLSIGVRFGK